VYVPLRCQRKCIDHDSDSDESPETTVCQHFQALIGHLAITPLTKNDESYLSKDITKIAYDVMPKIETTVKTDIHQKLK